MLNYRSIIRFPRRAETPPLLCFRFCLTLLVGFFSPALAHESAPHSAGQTRAKTGALTGALTGVETETQTGAKPVPQTSKLPLGDGKISSFPVRGYVMACSSRFPGGGGAHRSGAWLDGSTWSPAAKPRAEGAVAWPNAAISVQREGVKLEVREFRVIRANNLPLHTTGEFPIQPGTSAFGFDRNPNRITEQPVLLRLPAAPQFAAEPGCVPMGMIGFALSGVAIFNAFDLAGRDAPAYEIQDACNGHPERTGQYHYHDWSECMTDASGAAGKHSDVVGYMLDGFAIFGPKGEAGIALKNEDLDECHGHTHAVELDGKTQSVYHYHFTAEYPYTLGCFRGAVAPELLRREPPGAARTPQ